MKLLKVLNSNHIKYITNCDYKNYSSLKSSQLIKLMIFPKIYKELILLIKYLSIHNIKYDFISYGTNTLIINNDIIIINLTKLPQLNKIRNNTIIVSSNYKMSILSNFYKNLNIKTFVGGTKIPGSIGAGVIGNAGIKDITICKYLKYIIYLDLKDYKIKKKYKKDIDFYYRSSSLCNIIVLRCIFMLKKDINTKLMYNNLINIRLNQPKGNSLGSTFKNNEKGYAGKLIDDIGLKGVIYKGFTISDIHANFILSKGQTFCIDYYILVNIVRILVYLKTNILLDLEVKIIS